MIQVLRPSLSEAAQPRPRGGGIRRSSTVPTVIGRESSVLLLDSAQAYRAGRPRRPGLGETQIETVTQFKAGAWDSERVASASALAAPHWQPATHEPVVRVNMRMDSEAAH